MPSIILPDSRRVLETSRLDAENTLSRGIVSAINPGMIRDAATNRQVIANATRRVFPRGRAYALNAGASNYVTSAVTGGPLLNGASHMMVYIADTSASGYERGVVLNGASHFRSGIQLFNGNTNMQIFACLGSENNNSYANFTANSNDSRVHIFIGCWGADGAYANAFFDGAELGATTLNGTGTPYGNYTSHDAGRLRYVGGEYFGNYTGILEAVSWARCLSPAEAKRISRDFLRIYEPKNASVYFAVVSGGGTTLAADNSTQNNTSSSGDISQTHVLGGDNATQANSSAAAGIVQDHILSGDNSTQSATSSPGSIEQTHVLAGDNATQANTSSAGAIEQTHAIAGDNATQVNTSSAGDIGQTHVLGGDNSTQTNTSSAAGIIMDNTVFLGGDDSTQNNTSSSGDIGQDHILGGDNSTQSNNSSSAGISQTHALSGDGSEQVNTSSPGGIIVDGSIFLGGDNSTQNNSSSAGAVGQTHVLSGSNSTQSNQSSAGAIVEPSDVYPIGMNFELAALIAGIQLSAQAGATKLTCEIQSEIAA